MLVPRSFTYQYVLWKVQVFEMWLVMDNEQSDTYKSKWCWS